MVGLAEGKGLFFRRPYRKIAVLLVVVSWNTTPCTPYGYVCQLVGLQAQWQVIVFSPFLAVFVYY